ncbi:MAG: metallophosphatase [Candidatus Bipolaricaulota bacterium]
MVARAILVLVAWLAAATPAAAVPLTILYTNDLHARQERLASLERLLDAERAADPDVLLVDGGDALQDFRIPTYAVWGGEAMLRWMERVGYDAMALGNHELYLAPHALRQWTQDAAFPLLSANVEVARETPRGYGSAVVVRGGLRVLVVGLTTPQYFPLFDLSDVVASDPVASLAREIAHAGKVDLVVCVAHIPLREAAALARRVPEVDVFVTGHSHERTVEPRIVGNAVLVQAGAFGRELGRLSIDVAPEGVTVLSNDLLPSEKEAAGPGLRTGLERLALTLAGIAAFLAFALL